MIDRSSIWIGLSDLLLCVVSVALVCVNPPEKSKGVDQKAEYLLTASWPNTLDADVDLWAAGPSQKPVFYGARDVGCGRLDQDERGFMDGHVQLADGSVATVPEFKETISIRCIEFGHWDVAVALYAYHDHGRDVEPGRRDLAIPVHVELVALNPTVKVLYAKDVTLDHVSQSVNTFSFDLDRAGRAAMADPPLELIVQRWQRTASRASGETP